MGLKYWCTAAICGLVYPAATISDCTNKAAVSGRNRSGGIVGFFGGIRAAVPSGYEYDDAAGYVEGCYNMGDVITAASQAGGVVGGTQGNVAISDCHNAGNISTSGERAGWCGGVIGGLVGVEGSGTLPVRATLKNCTNTGDVTASFFGTGGIVGMTEATDIEDCVNSGDVYGYSNVGGIVGQAEVFCTVASCRNEGSVNSRRDVDPVSGDPNVNTGGIIGLTFDLESITECVNTGAINGGRAVGGIIGTIGRGEIVRCYNIATVDGYRITTGYIGGIIGCHYDTTPEYIIDIHDCYNTGALKSLTYAGGIAPNLGEGSTISGCYNIGDIDDHLTHSAGICVTNNGSIVSTYWIDNVSDSRAAVETDIGSSETYKFSGTNWPSPDGANWTPAVWSSLGSFVLGKYPTLKWAQQ